MPHCSTPRVRLRLNHHLYAILLALYILYKLQSCDGHSSIAGSSSSNVNLATGPVSHDQSSSFDFENFNEPEESKPRAPNVLTGPLSKIQTKIDLQSEGAETKRVDRKTDPGLSTDCFGKRREILRKHRASKSLDAPIPSSYQRLRPRHNESLDSSSSPDSEHIPQCTSDGKYEPIQCHQIGYCWCVNKFGQAIKNSASHGEKPFCDTNMYESESNNLLVVTGVSAHRAKGLLKGGGSASSGSASSVVNFGSDPDADPNLFDQDGIHQPREREDEFSRRVSTSQEPSLALVPNECALSRDKAILRASKHIDDSIWIPDCDARDNKLYSEKQCHKMTVCWCVDQGTGLPLRTSEQLTKQTTINCTEIKRIIDIASVVVKKPTSFSNGFSESCDTDRRAKFVLSLINQFRKQIGEFMELNPSHHIPEGLKSDNPYELSESQTSMWKFAILDQDHNGNLDDREWSKFKVNFKLLDKPEDKNQTNKPSRPEISPQFSSSPLTILRAQRRCWRDFLQFCGGGDILNDESITLSKWLGCTEVPNRPINDRSRVRPAPTNSGILPDAYTRAAAIARSKKKNPFLGILKPD